MRDLAGLWRGPDLSWFLSLSRRDLILSLAPGAYKVLLHACCLSFKVHYVYDYTPSQAGYGIQMESDYASSVNEKN